MTSITPDAAAVAPTPVTSAPQPTGQAPAATPTRLNTLPAAHALRLVVERKDSASDGVVTLTLVDPEGRRLPDWTPGAHVDLMLPEGVVRQYSLCGDRYDAHRYTVGVLHEPDSRGGSRYVHETLAVGDLVEVGGPRNTFPLHPARSYVFVAGGIGITPMLPMIEQTERLGIDWRLIYLGRSRATMAFAQQLAPYGDRVRLHPADELGRLSLADDLGPHTEGRVVYACGPTRLLDALGDLAADWPEGALRVEHFTADEPVALASDTSFDVVLARSDRTVTVGRDESVLAALRNAGTHPMASCERGICGTCEVDVLDGTPDHRDSVLSSVERSAGDCLLVCVSRSRTPRLVLDV